MYFNRREIEELQGMPFWERVALPRFLHFALAGVVGGGCLIYLDWSEPGWIVELLFLVPISLGSIGWFGLTLGVAMAGLWTVATVRKRRSRDSDN